MGKLMWVVGLGVVVSGFGTQVQHSVAFGFRSGKLSSSCRQFTQRSFILSLINSSATESETVSGTVLFNTRERLQYAHRGVLTPCLKNRANLFFLSELCQISTDCEKFWHKDSKEDKLFWGVLIFHLT